MLSRLEIELYEHFQKDMASEVSVVYKKEAGIAGKTTLSINGPGSMLFDAVCTILKKIAQAEGKRMGSPRAATEYVKLVCSMACEELKEGD